MNKGNKILFVGGHIDDAIIGCFGLIRGLEGEKYLLSTTDNLPEVKDERITSKTKNEITSVIRRLNIKDYFEITAKDGKSHEYVDTIKESIGHLINSLSPRIVVFPHYEGGHIDHDIASFLTYLATKEKNTHLFEYSLYNYFGGRINHHDFVNGKESKHILSENDMLEKRKILRLMKTKKKGYRFFHK